MSKREINLLSDTEVSDLYDIPIFNRNERDLYFCLNTQELKLASKYQTTNTKLYFILQLGYFKAKQQFFSIKFENVVDDINYVFHEYGCGDIPLIGSITRERIYSQQKILLDYFNYKKNRNELKYQLASLIKYHPKPHNAMRELITYAETQKIILPSYRTLQDLYTDIFQLESDRLSDLLKNLPPNISEHLDILISKDDGILSLNDVRYDQSDFSYTEINEEIEKVIELRELYEFCKYQLPLLNLSQNAINYYSRNVEQYPTSRLRKMKLSQQYLHALCYIHHRYQMFIDNLITSFMHHTVLMRTAAKEFGDAEFAARAAKIIKQYPSLSEFFRWFPQHENIQVEHQELYHNAYKIIPKPDFEKFAKYFEGSDFDIKAAKWKYIEENSRSISLYLRPIILATTLEHYRDNHSIIPLVKIIKDHYSTGKGPSKLRLSDDIGLNIPAGIVPYLKSDPTDQYLNPYRFEFYVYTKVYHHLYRGRMYCNDSVLHRDIDCDLVSESMVDNAVELTEKYGYDKIPMFCGKHLNDKLEELSKTWKNVTDNIAANNNPGINIIHTENGSINWQLNYDASEKLDDTFFKKLTKLDIADLFAFVDGAMNNFAGFEHSKGRYVKRTKPIAIAITACVLSEAFGFGIKKMAEMSDLNYNTLRTTKEDFVRYETLCKVNDIIADYINELPIFKAWNLLDDKLLADIDGQKASTLTDTIQSRYSRKYLGKGKGLSILSLIANFVAVGVKNIGLNEYEGHHLYDMIYDNQSNVKIDAVTGDNHTLNQLNFLALDSINVDFIPGIKNIKIAAEELYSVDDVSNYTGLIKPIGKIKVEKIISQEKQIIRVLLSLVLQENTQSTIIRKLNSHSRYAALRAGIVEYNKIFKSIHVLNMINDMSLRKAIRTARNRTESYHQLQKLIRKLYHGIYKGKRIVDHKVSTQAVRLVTNVVIAYNSVILDKLYIKMLESGHDQSEIEKFLRISPMAWIHIAFTGKYTFNGKSMEFDIDKIVDILAKELKRLGIKPLKAVA